MRAIPDKFLAEINTLNGVCIHVGQGCHRFLLQNTGIPLQVNLKNWIVKLMAIIP